MSVGVVEWRPRLGQHTGLQVGSEHSVGARRGQCGRSSPAGKSPPAHGAQRAALGDEAWQGLVWPRLAGPLYCSVRQKLGLGGGCPVIEETGTGCRQPAQGLGFHFQHYKEKKRERRKAETYLLKKAFW